MSARAKVILPLLSEALRLGKQIVSEDGVFYPFGLGLEANGNILIGGSLYNDHYPDPRECYEELQKKIATEIATDKFAAVAIAVDATVPEGHASEYQEAIRIFVEASGYTTYFYYPYRREPSSAAKPAKRIKSKTVFGSSFTVEAAPKYFRSGLVLSSDVRALESPVDRQH